MLYSVITDNLACSLYTHLCRYEKLPTEWSPPTKEEYKEKVHVVLLKLLFFSFYCQGNVWSWLLNPDCHDQYSVIHNTGATVSVFTNTNTEPKLVMTREVGSFSDCVLVEYHSV